MGGEKRRCCSNTRTYADIFALSEVNYSQLFTDEDVDIPLDNRKRAEVMVTLPDDAGPKGEARARPAPAALAYHVALRRSCLTTLLPPSCRCVADQPAGPRSISSCSAPVSLALHLRC